MEQDNNIEMTKEQLANSIQMVILTLVPNGSLGSTVFGTTPEESDLQSGNTPEAEVEVVDQGFAITTTKTID